MALPRYPRPRRSRRGNRRFSLTHNGVISGIYLESAAFVFHMMPVAQGIIGSLRAACSEAPSNGFWLAPSANQNRRPKHAGVSRHPSRAPGQNRRAPAFCNGKNHLLTSFQDFGLAEPIRVRSTKRITSPPRPSRPRPSRSHRRPRRPRHRPDRHRQDRSLRAADPASPRRQAACGRSPRACRVLVLSPDPRTVRPDRSTASTPMAATSACSRRRWRSAACRSAARSAR